MATKFSEFQDGGILRDTDTVVGLRGGVNTRMTLTGGIKDTNGNYLLGWSTVGVTAANYVRFTNAATGNAPLIDVTGILPNIPLAITTYGSGNITITPGTSGELIAVGTTSLRIPTGTTGERPIGVAGSTGIRMNTTTGYLEYFNGTTWVEVINGAAIATATFVTNTNETATLPNSQPLSLLATGIMKVTTATGIVSSLAIPLTEVNGGTAQSTYTLGDTLYSSGANTLAKLSGNITTVKQFLSQTGTGVVSAAPVWSTISGGDITGAALTEVSDTNVTLTLGGTPATALLRAASITAGWTGQLAVGRGGSNTDGSSFHAYMPLLVGTTNTGAFQSVDPTGASAGDVLTFVSNSAVPTWQANAGSTAIQTIDGDSGSMSGTTVTISGSTTGLTTSASAATMNLTGILNLAHGGSNANLTASNGGIVWSNATQMQILAGTATANQMLQSGATATPAWSTSTWPATTTINQLLYSSSANTVAGLATANSATMFTTSGGVPGWTGSMTNGQLLIGSTGASPTLSALTQGDGVTITNGAGSITISATGEIIVNQNSNSVTMAPNRVYMINNGASQVNLTLPSTAAQSDKYTIVGGSSGLFKVSVQSGQTLYMGTNSTTISTGTMISTQQYDCVTIRCITANTNFVVSNSQGIMQFT